MPATMQTAPSRRKARDRRDDVGVTRGIERLTFRGASFASALEGMTNGLVSLNAYVALIALGGASAGYEPEISTLVTMLPSVAMLLAAAYNGGGTVRRRRRYFLFAAVFGRLIFLAVPFLVLLAMPLTPFAFVLLVGLSSLVCAGVPPALNQLWGANYVPANRGRNFAWLSSIGMFMVMISALLAGQFLDASPVIGGLENWQLLYPVAGITGALALIGFYRIRMRHAAAVDARDAEGTHPFRRLLGAYGRAYRLLRRDRNFFTYEVGFFLYGIAFMMLLPAVPVLFSKYLRADYGDFSRATVVTTQCTLMFMAPFVARLARGRRVALVTGTAFLALMAYPAILVLTALTGEITYAYVAFVAFGIAMSGVHFVWNLGPVTFARGGNSLSYTSTHTSLVGARSLVGFPLGYVLMKIFPDSLTPVFTMAVGMLMLGAFVMFRLDRKMRRAGLEHTT